jgi:hypothetical protein
MRQAFTTLDNDLSVDKKSHRQMRCTASAFLTTDPLLAMFIGIYRLEKHQRWVASTYIFTENLNQDHAKNF